LNFQKETGYIPGIYGGCEANKVRIVMKQWIKPGSRRVENGDNILTCDKLARRESVRSQERIGKGIATNNLRVRDSARSREDIIQYRKVSKRLGAVMKVPV
jgi:hypothetical protein